jgi:hypothetical protein
MGGPFLGPPPLPAADQAEAVSPARLLGIPSRQAGSVVSLPISRALSSARSDLFLIRRSRWSFPAEPDGSFHRSEGCSAINGRGAYGSRFSALLFPSSITDRVALGQRCRFEVRRLAVIYRRRFRYRRRGKAGSKPVAIIATVDRGSLIAAGATEQSRNRGAHDRPNACSISVWASTA